MCYNAGDSVFEGLSQTVMRCRPLLAACRMWKPGQPDNWGHGHDISGEDCAGLVHDALWNDFFCEDLISYICQKERQQRA